MFGIFIILIVLSLAVAQYSWRRYEGALQAGRKLVIPGGLTAAEVAKAFLEANGAEDVRIMKHDALVSDYFDSGRRCLYLNGGILSGTDAASLAVALHEAAHALQQGASAPALKWRESTIRMTRYVPALIPLALIGLLMIERVPFSIVFRSLLMITGLAWFMITAMSAMSLPIEFNASQRALAFLESKLGRYPKFVEAMTGLLKDVALRDTGAFVRSPAYCLTALMPVGGRLRPTK